MIEYILMIPFYLLSALSHLYISLVSIIVASFTSEKTFYERADRVFDEHVTRIKNWTEDGGY